LVDGTIFSLPTGAVDIAIGGGYRHESFTNSNTGSTTINANRSLSYGFFETHVPLVTEAADRPGLHSLDFSASVRVADYELVCAAADSLLVITPVVAPN